MDASKERVWGCNPLLIPQFSRKEKHDPFLDTAGSHMPLKWTDNTSQTTCLFLFALPCDKQHESAPVIVDFTLGSKSSAH